MVVSELNRVSPLSFVIVILSNSIAGRCNDRQTCGYCMQDISLHYYVGPLVLAHRSKAANLLRNVLKLGDMVLAASRHLRMFATYTHVLI